MALLRVYTITSYVLDLQMFVTQSSFLMLSAFSKKE